MALKQRRQRQNNDAPLREKLPTKAELAQLSTVELVQQVETLSQAVIQSPEENGQIAKVQVLLDLLEHDNAFVVQMACLSLSEVFVDIAPMYKIDENAHEQQLQQMTKKDERNIIQYELKLLRFYNRYVNSLCCFTRLKSQQEAVNAVQRSAVRACCRLMKSLFHFNYANVVVQHVTFGMLHPNQEVAELVYQTVCEMLSQKQHSLYELKMCILTHISKMLQSKKESELPDWLIECANTVELDTKFLLKEIEKDEIKHQRAVKKKTREFFSQREKSKKDKKILKEKLDQTKKLLTEVRKEREEAKVDYDKKQIAKQNADVLNKLFYLYCKVVKQETVSKFFSSALDGILKFCHLVNIELIEGLLKHLIESCRRSKTKANPNINAYRLQTIDALSKIMNGPGQAFEIDYTSTIKALMAQ